MQEEINNWNGMSSELSLAWCEDAITRFDESVQAAARLALLTALSPHKMDKETVLDFRKHFPQDEKLVGVLAWASFAAAKRIGTWLQPIA